MSFSKDKKESALDNPSDDRAQLESLKKEHSQLQQEVKELQRANQLLTRQYEQIKKEQIEYLLR